MRSARSILAWALSWLAGACGALEEQRDRVVVDRFSELLIVDEELLVANAASETLDFAALLRALLREQADAATGAWIEAWGAASDRPEAFAESVLCPWLRSRPENACDARCGQCDERVYTPEQAPFRLTAIAYRPDLALGMQAEHPQGQLRFVFALRSTEDIELPVTLIFEYPLSARWSAARWAARFHALATERSDLMAYRRALQALARAAIASDPGARVTLRVRDDLSSDGRMLAWAVDAAGGLTRLALEDTVDLAHGSLASLRAALPDHELSSQELHVPARFWADSVTRATPTPELADHALSASLRLISCQGCHADERSQGGFHIAPAARGRARVSRFLHDPEQPADDELARREDALRTLLRALESPPADR
jgi:hypothetical protein